MRNTALGIEGRVHKRAKRQQIQNILLVSIYTATALGMITIAPNSAQLLRYINKFIEPAPKLSRRISQAITRLDKKGLVGRTQTNKGSALRLTEKGKRFAESLEAKSKISVRKP